jgi:hypothetical protein
MEQPGESAAVAVEAFIIVDRTAVTANLVKAVLNH